LHGASPFFTPLLIPFLIQGFTFLFEERLSARQVQEKHGISSGQNSYPHYFEMIFKKTPSKRFNPYQN